MQQILEQIQALFSRNHTPVFGITRAKSLENEPLGYRPSDLLASAQSILCLGMPVPKGIFQSEERSEWLYWRAANIYYRNIDAV